MAWDADIIDDRVKDQYDSKKNNKNKFRRIKKWLKKELVLSVLVKSEQQNI